LFKVGEEQDKLSGKSLTHISLESTIVKKRGDGERREEMESRKREDGKERETN